MTEQNEEQHQPHWKHDFTDDPHGLTLEDTKARDGFLDILLDQYFGFDDSDAQGGIGLTLLIGGNVVSGIAISRRQWSELFLARITEAHPSVGESFKQFEEVIQDQAQKQYEARDEAGLPAKARRFIHLKDVIINPSTSSLRFDIWRGVLDAVDGWSLGSWQPKVNATE